MARCGRFVERRRMPGPPGDGQSSLSAGDARTCASSWRPAPSATRSSHARIHRPLVRAHARATRETAIQAQGAKDHPAAPGARACGCIWCLSGITGSGANVLAGACRSRSGRSAVPEPIRARPAFQPCHWGTRHHRARAATLVAGVARPSGRGARAGCAALTITRLCFVAPLPPIEALVVGHAWRKTLDEGQPARSDSGGVPSAHRTARRPRALRRRPNCAAGSYRPPRARVAPSKPRAPGTPESEALAAHG
jgi:hypothetical protein